MKKLTLLSLIFFSSLTFGQTVPPQGINFQAVLFDEFGTPVPSLNENSTLNNQSAEATFTFYNFSSGLNYYSETHSIATDEFGRFQVVLGRGTPLGSSTFQDIVWSDGNIFLDFEVALNGQSKRLVSSQELLSVPYALFAGGIQGASDLDPDPSNEIQELAIDADSIYITKGNAVPVPLDGDKSSSNELQSISVSGNQITISNGNTVTLPAVLDASPTNELQNLSTQGDSLTITNGNTVITDPSSTNELQNLSVQANDLTITGGNTVALPVSLDNDSTNELQSIILTQSGHLKLSSSVDSVKISVTAAPSGILAPVGFGSSNSSEYCWQGNPEVFHIPTLSGYTNQKVLVVFDSSAYVSASNSQTTFIFHVDLYDKVILSTSSPSTGIPNNTMPFRGYQSNSIGYLFGVGTYYTVDESGFIDTTSCNGALPGDAIVYENSDLTWFTSSTANIFDYSTGLTSTISYNLSNANASNVQPVGNDSILIDNILFNKNTMTSVKVFSNATSVQYSQNPWYRYNPIYNKVIFRKATGTSSNTVWSWHSCDLSGSNENQMSNASTSWLLTLSKTTIGGVNIFETPAGSSAGIYNNYYQDIPASGGTGSSYRELLGLGLNGAVYVVKKGNNTSNDYQSKGKYTVYLSTDPYECVSGQSTNTSCTLLRWNR